MRIERVRVEAFGRLRGWDSGADALPGLVTVLGPNEAGKSTLFHCLTTLLYGFRPATRENNPYAPWGGPDAAAAALIRLDGSRCVEVERRLLSQPAGRMTLDGRGEDIRNRALPWTEHVPMQVFRQVFALTLADLAGLDDETWGRVQDRIVGSMGTADIVPAREAAAELEREAGELWRPSRRGNQRIRDIQEEIRRLRVRRRDALDRDRSLRGLVVELDRVRDDLHDAREARQRERLAVERVEELLPVRRQLRRIAALREEAGSPETLRDLPGNPAEHMAVLERRLEELASRRDGLERERAEPDEAASAFGERDAEVLSHADAIAGLTSRVQDLAVERARAHALEQEVVDLDRRGAQDAELILAVPAGEAEVRRLEVIPTSELRGRVDSYCSADEELRILEEAEARRVETLGRTPTSTSWIGAAAVAMIGGVLLVRGFLADDVVTALAGGLVVLVGAVLLLMYRGARGKADPGRGTEPVRRARERAKAEVVELLGGLAVAPSWLEEPSARLVSTIERLQDVRRARADRLRALGDLRTRLDSLDAEARGLASSLRCDSGMDAQAIALLLERELRGAERRRDAAAAAERELRRADRERQRIDEEGAALDTERSRLLARLRALGGGNERQGARVAADRMRAAERADQLQDELERSRPALDEEKARIGQAEAAGEQWTLDDDDLVRRRARIEEFGEAIERLATGAEALDRDIAHARDLETPDAVDGEIAALLEEEARLTFERDRNWILAQLMRAADRRFREEHQPDLMRRASDYLAHLTEGRYDRIAADETAGGDLFHIYGPTLPVPVPLTPPISTGTLEQAYLSLRLAIVDHLDQGGERLPLFVDEVLVNWDQERRARGMDVLAEVSAKRQLFVFTCHDDVAADLARRGARVVELPDR